MHSEIHDDQHLPKPIVTAIVPVYNGQSWLAEALDSALAQTYQPLEILVVNDGSTDDSATIARQWARRANGRIQVIDQNNVGLPAARNTALRCGHGQYYALLDADDAWYPDHLSRAMAAFERDPDLGLVHANIERVDSQGRTIDIPTRNWAEQDDAYEAIALRHEHVSCPTAVFSRTAISAVGGFDVSFTGLGCEDRDLWLRIAARFRIGYLDHVAARYRVHPESMSARHEQMELARRLLIAKQASTVRGRALAASMEAMIESDLGLEFLELGQYARAIVQQWRALLLDPYSRTIRRRLARAAYTACTVKPWTRPRLSRGSAS